MRGGHGQAIGGAGAADDQGSGRKVAVSAFRLPATATSPRRDERPALPYAGSAAARRARLGLRPVQAAGDAGPPSPGPQQAEEPSGAP